MSGGGISNGGTVESGGKLTVTNSTVSGNTGNGIYNGSGGTLAVIGSTVSGNSASGDGGGVDNAAAGTVAIMDSTICNSGRYGGGIYNVQGVVGVTDSTVAGNSASDGGGGIYNYASVWNGVILYNTIVASNNATSPDICGAVTASSYNLIVGDGSSGLTNGITGTRSGPLPPPWTQTLDRWRKTVVRHIPCRSSSAALLSRRAASA